MQKKKRRNPANEDDLRLSMKNNIFLVEHNGTNNCCLDVCLFFPLHSINRCDTFACNRYVTMVQYSPYSNRIVSFHIVSSWTSQIINAFAANGCALQQNDIC